MYVPARKPSSLKSNASSKKSKTSSKKVKPYKLSTAYTVVPDDLMPAQDKKEDATSFKDYMNDTQRSNKSVKSGKSGKSG